MAAFPWCVLLVLAVAWTPSASASSSSRNAIDGALTEPAGWRLESSGGGPREPPALLLRGGAAMGVRPPDAAPPAAPPAWPGLFKRGPSARRGGGPAAPFPAFLSRGRAGPAPVGAAPPHHPRGEKEGPGGPEEEKKRQGLRMWQQAVGKERHQGKVSLGLSLKEARLQACRAVPFTQRVTVEGCEPVSVPNKLCFGQCSSLYVPSGALDEGEAGEAERARRRGGCSRCSPSRTRTARVALSCGSRGAPVKRVAVVEECRCETGREENGGGDLREEPGGGDLRAALNL